MGRRARKLEAREGMWYVAVRKHVVYKGAWHPHPNGPWPTGAPRSVYIQTTEIEREWWTASMPYDSPGKAMGHNGGVRSFEKALEKNPTEPDAYVIEMDWTDGRKLFEDKQVFHERMMLKHGRLFETAQSDARQSPPPARRDKRRKSPKTGEGGACGDDSAPASDGRGGGEPVT